MLTLPHTSVFGSCAGVCWYLCLCLVVTQRSCTAIPLVRNTLSAVARWSPSGAISVALSVQAYVSFFVPSLTLTHTHTGTFASHTLCVNVIVALVFVTWRRNAIKLRHQSVAMPKKFGFEAVATFNGIPTELQVVPAEVSIGLGMWQSLRLQV